MSVWNSLLAVIVTSSVVSQQGAAFTTSTIFNHVERSKPSFAAVESLLFSSAAKPSDEDPVFDTIMRFELKRELLQAAREFQELQQEMFDVKQQQDKVNKNPKWYERRNRDLIGGGTFGAQSFASIEVDLGEKGDEVIALAERLSKLSVNKNPLHGWMSEDCALNGKWELQFTSGADATFPEWTKREKATTSQIINATDGTLTNTIEFERGKVKGFKVVVEGEAISGAEMNLKFKRVVIERKSKWPRLFGKIVIRIPSFSFLSAYARFSSRGRMSRPRATGPGFVIQYMDDDMRMHKTRDGIWFIQTRVAD